MQDGSTKPILGLSIPNEIRLSTATATESEPVSQIGFAPFSISGDVGGVGVSVCHFQRSDLGTITSADCSSAGAAWRALWQAAHTEVPSSVTIAPFGEVEVKDSATGAPVGSVAYGTVPSAVFGSSTAHYAAGTGVRISWNTSTVHGRRLIQGATFLVPLTSDAFVATGTVNSVIQSNYITAAATYLSAMATANLTPIVWHRPAKGTFVGGVAGPITGGKVGGTAAFLKSRRS